MHLLSSDKISFSMAIWRKCLEHSVVFPVNLFWSNLHLMFPPLPFSWNSRVWLFFSSILGIEAFFWKVLKFFWVVMKDKVITHKKKIEKHDSKRVHLMYCFNFFRNHLWQHLISYKSFRNMNMCLLEVPMREKCRSSHFQWKGGVKSLRTGGG